VEARRIDLAQKRGRYMVKGPNRVWSIDGYDKLAPYGFQIYGFIDGYSRFMLGTYVGVSNRTAVSVNKQYLAMVREHGIVPDIVRSDKGTETVLLANSQLLLRRQSEPDLPFHKAYSYGKSTRNIRIESWWALLAKGQLNEWREFFTALKAQDMFNGGDIDIIALQFIYMNLIRAHVKGFVETHNNHSIKKQRLRAHYLPTGRPYEMFKYPSVPQCGSIPDFTLLSELDTYVSSYDLNASLPESVNSVCCSLLLKGGYNSSFHFQDPHKEAYLYLRDQLFLFSNNGGHLFALLLPLGALQWIEKNKVEIEAHQRDDLLLKLDTAEEKQNSGSDSENVSDNRYLNIVS
jgi:hypothetical protein